MKTLFALALKANWKVFIFLYGIITPNEQFFFYFYCNVWQPDLFVIHKASLLYGK